MTRPRFLLLLGAPMVVAVLVLTLALSGERDVPLAGLPTSPTLVASLRLEPALPKAGQEVVVHITLAADRPVTPSGLTVEAVHLGTGDSHHFPELRDHEVGTTEQEISLQRVFDVPGEYNYYLAYRMDDRSPWTGLRPWETFTVR
ncbi:hypothetical protein [Saccharothrix hoggarensis]|uniref:Uncharacterized protein n=1 Tax=Saccharothrix hoggarensis TaxID=913853 RepID=A0ABW3R0Z7_9PSEU